MTKVLAVGEPPCPTEVAPLAAAAFAGRADVTISHPRFLEFVAPGVSKGRAVRWLARRLGIPLGATLAVGDQWNDLEMLAEVGHGAAMPTAPAAVRAVARYVAPPLEEEGVAQLIEALVLADPTAARAASRRLAAAADAAPASPRGVVTARIVPDDAAGRAVAIEALRAGGIVAIPTDTVYGIGVALSTPGGIERLFAVKQRPPEKGIVLLLADAAQAAGWAYRRPPPRRWPSAFWPGGLTLSCSQRADVGLPAALTGGVPDDRPSRPRPRRAAGAGPRARSVPGHLGQRLGPAGGRDGGRDPARCSATRSSSSSTAARPTAARPRRSSTAPATVP